MQLAQRLKTFECASEKVALVAENSHLWVVADLALMIARKTEVPVPTAFSSEQVENMLAGVDLFVADAQGFKRLNEWIPNIDHTKCVLLESSFNQNENFGESFELLSEDQDDWICKVIHTSGTTGNPKGVRIKLSGISALVDSLRDCISTEVHYRKYLSLVPLSLLIEQVTGLYLPLTSGGRVVFLHPEHGLLGVSSLTAKTFLPIIRASKPTALTLTPALAEAISEEVQSLEGEHLSIPEVVFNQAKVPFMACGGAPTDSQLIKRLYYKGVTIYEGYGLSENSSVVTWNTPEHFRIGTVGKPLQHVEVKIGRDGELLIRGKSLCDGYETLDPTSCAIDQAGWLRTGDLATIDSDGYVTITGRKKNIIITANARNVAPEWVESKFRNLPFIRNVALFGDGLQQLHGLFIIEKETDEGYAESAIREFGYSNLSDIERPERIHIVPYDADEYKELFTITGRPMRKRIQEMYAELEEATNA